MMPGDPQAVPPGWLLFFLTTGSFDFCENSVLKNCIADSRSACDTHYKSRSFFAILSHKSKWLSLRLSSMNHINFFFRLFLWCALQHIYNLSQLHVIRKLNKYSPYRIIQIIMKTKILNRNAIRTDLFQAAPRTLSCMFLKMKDW